MRMVLLTRQDLACLGSGRLPVRSTFQVKQRTGLYPRSRVDVGGAGVGVARRRGAADRTTVVLPLRSAPLRTRPAIRGTSSAGADVCACGALKAGTRRMRLPLLTC